MIIIIIIIIIIITLIALMHSHITNPSAHFPRYRGSAWYECKYPGDNIWVIKLNHAKFCIIYREIDTPVSICTYSFPTMYMYRVPLTGSVLIFITKGKIRSDVIWQRRSGSTLAQAMACCRTTPSHYLNQFWLLITDVLCYSSESNAQATILYNQLENHTFKSNAISPQGQWVNGN